LQIKKQRRGGGGEGGGGKRGGVEERKRKKEGRKERTKEEGVNMSKVLYIRYRNNTMKPLCTIIYTNKSHLKILKRKK
jgi:hypothetical protein